MAVQLDPGPNQIVGPTALSKRFGRGYRWARDLLREWWEEQQVPGYAGPIRVLRKRLRGGVFSLYTTRAVLDAVAPRGRDEVMVRAVKELDRDVSAQARQMGEMREEIRRLAARVKALEGKR